MKKHGTAYMMNVAKRLIDLSAVYQPELRLKDGYAKPDYVRNIDVQMSFYQGHTSISVYFYDIDHSSFEVSFTPTMDEKEIESKIIGIETVMCQENGFILNDFIGLGDFR